MKVTHTSRQPSSLKIKKRHWCLGTAVVLIGSWITHTTTAKISHSDHRQPSLEFARVITKDRLARGARLPDPLFVKALQTTNGPLSDSYLPAQSPADYLFDEQEFATQTPKYSEQAYTIKRGDTLGKIFKQKKLGLALPHAIGQHPEASRLTQLRVGSELFFGSDNAGSLKQLRYPINTLEELVVNVADDSIVDTSVSQLPFQTIEKVISGEISSSLYEAAQDAGLSIELIMEMVKIFGWDIDFVLDIRAGDSFHVVFEEFQLNGDRLSDGAILAAEFTTQNQTYRAIRFEDESGEVSYYNPEGESMLGTFLRSPVEFSRISSRFGKRKHPILKKWRAHKGVDYAASRGTPIRATADGKVIHAGKKGGYGKTVILRHAGRFSTLYAHMNGYGKNIRTGTRVKQGDTIGYIGSTGLATGPHLHYEFRLDGVHRNPLTFKTPKASAVSDEEMPTFRRLAERQLAVLDDVARRYRVAKLDNAAMGEPTGE